MAPTIITTTPVATAGLFAGGQPLDLVALADVKLELNITAGTDDAWLAKVITRASRAIARYTNRTFPVQTYQDQFWALRDPFPWQLPSGFFPLQLSAWPIASPPSLAGTPPPLAPGLSAVSGGALAAATYYVRATYVTPAGETAASIESRLAVAANNLLQVAAPGADLQSLATGWNVYIGTKSFGEILQNATPISVNTAFTLPASGLLTAGNAAPPYILVVENNPLAPVPLAEGIDFESDYDSGPQPHSVGWLTRLFPLDASPRRWSALPILVVYQAGYAANAIPDDLQDACIRLVKADWFARLRDPRLRSENVEGVYSTQYWFATGPGGGAFPPDVAEMLDFYRVPVIA